MMFSKYREKTSTLDSLKDLNDSFRLTSSRSAESLFLDSIDLINKEVERNLRITHNDPINSTQNTEESMCSDVEKPSIQNCKDLFERYSKFLIIQADILKTQEEEFISIIETLQEDVRNLHRSYNDLKNNVNFFYVSKREFGLFFIQSFLLFCFFKFLYDIADQIFK